MNVMHEIRTRVFRISQVEMAKIADVRQSTVSRWENGSAEPGLSELIRIRTEASRRRLKWRDAWFFKKTNQDTGAPAHSETGAAA